MGSQCGDAHSGQTAAARTNWDIQLLFRNLCGQVDALSRASRLVQLLHYAHPRQRLAAGRDWPETAGLIAALLAANAADGGLQPPVIKQVIFSCQLESSG